jgi:hypothetical protein
MNYPGKLPGNYNPNAALLADAPGAPSSYQAQQGVQQVANTASLNTRDESAQNASKIMDFARQVSSGESTAENQAAVMALASIKGVQANSGLPMTNVGTDPAEIMRQIGYA